MTINSMVVPRLFNIHLSNTNIGALDAPQEWSRVSSASNVQIQDEFDASILVTTSFIKFHASASQLKEIQQVLKHDSAPKRPATETRLKQRRNFSLCIKIPALSVSTNEVQDVTKFQSSLLIKDVNMALSCSHQTSLNVSAGGIGVLFTEGYLTLPIFYTIDDSQTQCSVESKSIDLSMRTGKIFIIMIPSFIKHATRLLAAVKDKKQRKGSHLLSGEAKDSVIPGERMRQFKRSIIVDVFSDGLNIVLPSQDVNSLSSDNQSQLNSICLEWSKVKTAISLKASKLEDNRYCQEHDLPTEVKAKDELNRLVSHRGNNYVENSVISSKLDTKASFCFTRTLLALRTRKQPDLPYFETVTEQCIISPVLYSVVASHIMMASPINTTVCSIGIHLDVEDVDILWHVTRSKFGISDALHHSVEPLRNVKQKHPPVGKQQDFDFSSLQASNPIHHREQSEPPNNGGMMPEKLRLFFNDSMIVFSIRVQSIQLTCVPGNAKEIQSPIMKLRISALRLGASIVNCQHFEGERFDKIDDPDLYFSSWLDFDLSGHYHNRRLVLWEPLIETWSGNLALMVNMNDAFGPVKHYQGDDLLESSGGATNTNRLVRFIEGMNTPDNDRNEEVSAEDSQSSGEVSKYICHLLQCITNRRHLELALHPSAYHRALNSRETFLHNGLPMNDDTSVAFFFSNGKARHLSPNLGVQTLPLNINVTGALIENVGLVLSDRQSDRHIAPHYICNETGLTMCLKVDNMEHLLANGERMDLPFAGFPKSSFISIELYKNRKSPRLKAVRKVNVDLVGAKRYALKSVGNRTMSYVVVR